MKRSYEAAYCSTVSRDEGVSRAAANAGGNASTYVFVAAPSASAAAFFAAPSAADSGSDGRTTAASNTSATICLQSAEREPPPTQMSSDAGATPSSVSRDAPPRSAYVAPSIAARYATPGSARDPGRRPSSAPVASGQLGVRSPTRYGRKRTPPQPGGTSRARAASASCDAASAPPPTPGGFAHARASSTTRVQLRVHSRGRYPPSASQKGAMAPVTSRIGLSLAPNSVPEVPSETTRRPGRVAPTPTAAHALSPEPVATRHPPGNPVASDASRVTTPTWASGGRTSFGSMRRSRASTASHCLSSYVLERRSKTPKPLASPASVATMPVSRKLT